jgi:tRNA(fMet)-specific endonuclease VapC
MLVLDSDIHSLIEFADAGSATARARIKADGREPVITIVTVQERLRGRIAACTAATDPDDYIRATRLLRRTFDALKPIRVLDFDGRPAAEFRRLKAARVRIGTMDLRIASITLALDALLISRNLIDFRKVSGLRVEDWTR